MTSSLMTCAVAIALMTASTGGTPLRAQSTSNGSRLPNIVLIHGAWADGSSWNGVIKLLQKAGYRVTAAQLPLSSLDDDVARTREVLSQQAGPTLLVAHSYGGAVISDLGRNAPNVVGLVYESAFAPDEGETLKGLVSGSPQPPGAVAIRPDKDGYLWLDAAGFLKFFAPDVNPVEARAMEAVQKPVAVAAFLSEQKFGAPTWRAFPTWYLVTANDQMVPPDAQRFFAKRMNATVTSVAGSHVSMVSHPDIVASFIMKAAQSLRTK